MHVESEGELLVSPSVARYHSIPQLADKCILIISGSMYSATDAGADDETAAGHARAHKLQAAQSLAMLEQPLTTSGRLQDSTTDDGDQSPLSLEISVRRGRLALLVGLVTCVVVALTLVLWRGAELKRFTRAELSVSAQEKLLDQYNSYSGNAASAVGRPLEVFLALMVQVVVLWLMTDAVLTVTTSWRVKLSVLALGASVGFLLTNGLNALNVQVRELPLTLVMSMSDLTIGTNATNSSTIEQSFLESSPESSAKNPTINTILRSLLLPRVATLTDCPFKGSGIASDTVSFGVSPQPWMMHLIPEALPEASVRIDLLTNDTSEAKKHLPMDASVAADLLLAGYNSRDDYSPVPPNATFDSDIQARQKYYLNATTLERYVPATRLVGLLPNDTSSSEAQKHEWFISRTVAFVRSATASDWQNASLTRWTMTLTRVNITPSVWVDAITVESEVAPTHLFHRQINGSRYYPTNRYRTFAADNRYPEAKIDAFAVCNDSGIDGVTTLFYQDGVSVSDICVNRSTTSMYVFSSGKRLVGEAVDPTLYYHNGSQVSTFPMWSYVKDLRYIYSTTFARINWRLQNLAEVYGTTCDDTEGGCMGLDAKLTTNQRLLVSANALPLSQVISVEFNQGPDVYPQQALELVAVRRPSQVKNGEEYEGSDRSNEDIDSSQLGDVVLGHNTRNVTADKFAAVEGMTCEGAMDRRVQNYINNHIYMETTLQATYTAAAFFLFQNGIAHDVVNKSAKSSSSVPLNLDHNIQELSAWLSIPALNAVLTLAGCVVLVVALVVALVSSHVAARAGTSGVQDPHQIARVMIDDSTFPSMLLKRRVSHKGVEGDADKFLINTLSVRPLATTKDERPTGATAV